MEERFTEVGIIDLVETKGKDHMTRTFRIRAGFRVSKEIGQSVAAWASAQPGDMRPDALLDYARPAASPIHGAFEWNDQIAAEAHRIATAAFLLRALEEVWTNEDGEEIAAPMLRAMPRADDEGRESNVYTPTSKIVQSEADLQLIIARELDMIEGCQRRIAQYEAFRSVADEIAEALRKARAKVPTKPKRK